MVFLRSGRCGGGFSGWVAGKGGGGELTGERVDGYFRG